MVLDVGRGLPRCLVVVAYKKTSAVGKLNHSLLCFNFEGPESLQPDCATIVEVDKTAPKRSTDFLGSCNPLGVNVNRQAPEAPAVNVSGSSPISSGGCSRSRSLNGVHCGHIIGSGQ